MYLLRERFCEGLSIGRVGRERSISRAWLRGKATVSRTVLRAVLILISSSLVAQEPTTTPPSLAVPPPAAGKSAPAGETASPDEPRKVAAGAGGGDVWDGLKKNAVTEVALILTLVMGGVAAWMESRLKKWRTKFKDSQTEGKLLRVRLEHPRFGLVKDQTEYYQRCLLLGMGNVGKTTLIDRLFAFTPKHDDRPEPRASTATVRSYSLVHEVSGSTCTHVHRLDIDDYRGQNISSLKVSLAQNGSVAGDPFKITSIIVVIDLFDTAGDQGESVIRSDIDRDHILSQVSTWNPTTIGAVLGDLPRDIQFVGLFINKLDLLENHWGKTKREAIHGVLDPYYHKLVAEFPGAVPKLFIGSAEKGWEVGLLRGFLFERSVPLAQLRERDARN